MSLPTAIYSVQQIRSIEEYAFDHLGISAAEMMQAAGLAAFKVLRRQWPQAERIVIFCGTGNNAGDGFVVAKLAQEAGLKVHVLQLGDFKRLSGAALEAAQAALATGVTQQPFAATQKLQADVIVDAILGIGLQKPVTGVWQQAIEYMNVQGIPILALDVPSGLAADTGAVKGVAVKASATITFLGLKLGLLTAYAPEYVGKLWLHCLGIPQQLFAQFPRIANCLRESDLQPLLVPRTRYAHKGNFGHVLIIGGDNGMGGAVRLAGEAALRIGSGLVSVITRPEHIALVSACRPELMCYGIDTNYESITHLLDKATVIVLGPGLGLSSWAEGLIQLALSSRKPMVMDADALNWLAQHPMRSEQWVLTPHPGEAARLIKDTTREVQQDRLAVLNAITATYGGVCVLKGAGTLIGTSTERYLCTAGNPGMASGGMGDVLSGIVGGLIAQGFSLVSAAAMGVYVHAKAADKAAQQMGEKGLLATDVLQRIQQVINASLP